MHKMTEKYDIVIVGSGLGGLLCGAFLAKEGRSVCILEQHYQLGGNLQVFKRNNCSFSVGMHYAGAFDKNQILYKVLNYIGIADKLNFTKLDTDCFERIIIGDKEYSYAMGMENFQQNLINSFPEEKAAIEQYVQKLNQVWSNNDILNLRPIQFEHMANLEEYVTSAYDYINSLTTNEDLRAVLAATNGLYAGVKEKTPLFVHANINNFFIQSAWRIAEEGTTLTQLLVEVIENAGGKVLINKEVNAFEFDEEKISSVTCADGTQYCGTDYISNIHPVATFKMIPQGKLRKAYVQRIEELENSAASFTAYIVLKKKQFKHLNSNVYYSETNKVWENMDYTQENWPKGYMLYTTQDKENPEYAESLVVITMMKYEELAQWEHTTLMKRGDDYKAFKEKKVEQILEVVYKTFPELKDAIFAKHSASPLTYRDYTNSYKGSMYGILKDYNDPLKTSISPKTRIPNLLLTGQNVNIHGFLGVMMSSFLTCSILTDVNEIIAKINACNEKA